MYNHADYQGIIITKAQFYINYLNTSQPIQCKIFTESSSGVWETVLGTADATVTGSGTNTLETFNFASGVTTPTSGNGFFVACNHPDGDNYSPNGVNYVTTTELISNEIHQWVKYSGTWTDYSPSHAGPRVTNLILTYKANALTDIPAGSVYEESDTGEHHIYSGTVWNPIP